MKQISTIAGWVSAALLAVAIPGAAFAQFSDSYNFLKAVRDRDGAKVTEFVSKPGSVIVDARDQSTGEGALHIVTKRRDTDWLSFLLGKGAKPDIRDNEGNTPLMVATQIGFVEGANLLISVRAQVDLANSSGETPLIRAVQKRDTTMIRILLTAGANPARKDRIAGMTARDYAVRDARSAAIVRMLDEAQPAKPVAGPRL